MILTGDNRSTQGETHVTVPLSTINLMRTDLESIPGFHDERLATNRLSHSVASEDEYYLKTQSVPRSKHTPTQLYKPVS
jgi:hypothetical protein